VACRWLELGRSKTHRDDVTELGSQQACARHFEKKEHCSYGLKMGGAWAWLFVMMIFIHQHVVEE